MKIKVKKKLTDHKEESKTYLSHVAEFLKKQDLEDKLFRRNFQRAKKLKQKIALKKQQKVVMGGAQLMQPQAPLPADESENDDENGDELMEEDENEDGEEQESNNNTESESEQEEVPERKRQKSLNLANQEKLALKILEQKH